MRYILKLVLSAAVAFFLVTGCDTEELHDLNVNPQAVSEIDLHYLFSEAELSMASNGSSGDNRYIDWRTNIGLAAGAIQQLATTGSISAAGMYYRHNEETAAAPFEFTYNDQLKNIAEVIRQTDAGGFAEGEIQNTRNAAIIIKVWSLARLTDFYGPIPYTEANHGLEGIFFPKYDDQSFVYPALLAELEGAIAGLSAANFDPGFAAADMIYQGNIDKWKRFGNSLMLRMAMRMSNVDATTAASYVSKAVAGGVFVDNGDNVWIPMSDAPSEWTNQNGISRAFYPGDGGNQATLSKTLIDFLKGSNPGVTTDDDPRLMIYTNGIGVWTAASWAPTAKQKDPLNQRGFPSGNFQSTVAAQNGWSANFLIDTTFSRINPYMLDDSDPYMIMNHAEVEFLLAEAAEKGIGGVTAPATHYNAGVKSAMQMLAPYFTNNTAMNGVVSDAQVNAYLAAYPYGGGGVKGTESKLEQIGWQMWASKYLNWWEAWSDWRRTGFPILTEFTEDTGNVTLGKIPVRLPYPSTEVAANPNFTHGDKNNYTTPVWWDGGPE
jgi:Starch-binding associating with outer membrane